MGYGRFFHQNLRIVVNLKHDRAVFHIHNRPVDSARGHYIVIPSQIFEHAIVLSLARLLGFDNHKVEDKENQNQGEKTDNGIGAWLGLGYGKMGKNII